MRPARKLSKKNCNQHQVSLLSKIQTKKKTIKSLSTFAPKFKHLLSQLLRPHLNNPHLKKKKRLKMKTLLLTCLMALKSSEIAAVTQTRPSRSESQ
jgi:hypothetical protein